MIGKSKMMPHPEERSEVEEIIGVEEKLLEWREGELDEIMREGVEGGDDLRKEDWLTASV